MITAFIGVLMMPWKLIETSHGYIFHWLIAYSALLGAVGGILIADYFVIRRTRLELAGLYRQNGPYWYNNGVNVRALVALVAGITLCTPGFLGTIHVADVGHFWLRMYDYAWFISFAVAFVVYLLLMFAIPSRRTA